MATNIGELGPWLQRFLREYCSAQRNLSPATITAYRDTFRLLLRYLGNTRAGQTHRRSLEVLTPDTIVRFLSTCRGMTLDSWPWSGMREADQARSRIRTVFIPSPLEIGLAGNVRDSAP